MILLRKLWRDLGHNRVQFMSIFLMSFLGIYVFVGIDSEVTGMQAGEFRFYEESDLADLWVSGMTFSNDNEMKIRSMPEINYAERRLQTDGKAGLSGEPSVQMNFIEKNNISKMKIVEGTDYHEGEPGVWLDHTFAEKNGLSAGDVITLKLNGISFSEKIKGTFYHPEYVYYLPDASVMMPDYGTYGVAFMDVSQYPDKERFAFNQMIIDVKGIDNTGGLSETEKELGTRTGKKIMELLDSRMLAVTDKDSNISYQTFRSEMEQHEAMSFMYPLVFLMISFLGIITTMTRMTAKQRIQIGTLKALGFSKKTITLHYMSYGFVLSLAGAVLGAAAGYFTIPDLIISMFKTTYQLPYAYKGFSAKSFAGIAAEVLASAAVSYYACRKELRGIPAETLKPAAPGNLRHTALEKSRVWLKMDFSTQWNIRDMIRNKIRTVMGILGVAGCSMMLLCAFGCLDTVEYISGWMYGELNTADSQIIMKEGTECSTTEEYAYRYNGQMAESTAAEFTAGAVTRTGTVTVVDKGNYLHFQDTGKKHIELTGTGIAMSSKMAQNLGIKAGDFVIWHILGDDRYNRVRVTQLYRNPSSQGITMTRETFEKLDYEFMPTEILTGCSIPKELEDKSEIAGVQDMNGMMDALDAMKEMMYVMVGILIAAAAVLGIVVLYNLGVLSFAEKLREMATLKVLGFKTRSIQGILQKQNIWITAAGILLGIPCGWGLLVVLFATMPESMDYAAVIYAPSYLYTVTGTFILSISVTAVLSLKVRTVDMVDALKAQE